MTGPAAAFFTQVLVVLLPLPVYAQQDSLTLTAALAIARERSPILSAAAAGASPG